MNMLVISTATPQMSLAIYQDQSPLAFRMGIWPGEALMENILRLSYEAGLTLKKIGVIAVVNGPGGFTGLRVGLTTAKTLAYAQNKKLITVDALEATAMQTQPLSGTRMVIQAACRDEYNVALFGKGRLTPNTVMAEQDIIASLGSTDGEVFMMGDGAVALYPKLLKQHKKTKVQLVGGLSGVLTAHGVALRALELYREKQFSDPIKVLPVYSHPPNIKLSSKLNYEQLRQAALALA